MIRGEYWIVDGEAWFADGANGDMDHTAHALQHIRYLVLSEFGWDDDPEMLCDFSVFLDALQTLLGTRSMPDVAVRLNRGCTNPEQAIRLLSAAFEYDDARETALREFGWKWVKKDWIGTFHLTQKDMDQIAKGVDRILEEEEIETNLDDELEIRILATGRSLCFRADELLSRCLMGSHPVASALYSPQPGHGVTLEMDRQQLHFCYAGVGD